jgi:hypothetical protein
VYLIALNIANNIYAATARAIINPITLNSLFLISIEFVNKLSYYPINEFPIPM